MVPPIGTKVPTISANVPNCRYDTRYMVGGQHGVGQDVGTYSTLWGMMKTLDSRKIVVLFQYFISHIRECSSIT